jgi:CO/xanthine dehydrogenase Mo-binding subunit
MNQMSSPKTGLSRRGFMIGIAGLTFAVAVGQERFGHAATEAPDVSGTAFNPWVSIPPSGEISIMSPATEMGNGSLTSLPLILAEELDADWSKVVSHRCRPRAMPPKFGAVANEQNVYSGAKWPQASYIRMPLARIASASSAAGPLKVLPVPSRTNSTVPRSGRP